MINLLSHFVPIIPFSSYPLLVNDNHYFQIYTYQILVVCYIPFYRILTENRITKIWHFSLQILKIILIYVVLFWPKFLPFGWRFLLTLHVRTVLFRIVLYASHLGLFIPIYSPSLPPNHVLFLSPLYRNRVRYLHGSYGIFDPSCLWGCLCAWSQPAVLITAITWFHSAGWGMAGTPLSLSALLFPFNSLFFSFSFFLLFFLFFYLFVFSQSVSINAFLVSINLYYNLDLND